MPNTREKLIELLQNSVYENVELDDGYVGFDVNYEQIADYLIANGVTIPVRCKDCAFCNYNSSNETYKCTSMNGMYRTVEPDEFCSYGERAKEEVIQI